MSLRTDYTNRVDIPKMALSDASNPLTAPHPPLPSTLNAAERATARFAIHGNAIITGGSGDLALASARALLEHGLSGLSLLDLAFRTEAVDVLAKDFPDAKILTDIVNVTDDQAIRRAVQKTVEALGSVDILICFAGIVNTAAAQDITPETWRKVLDVNTTGAWLCAQAVGRQMIAQGTGGSIILTASCSAHTVNFPQPQPAYNASKAALISLKSSLAAEWARYGIRVNSVSPGYMNTVLNEGDGLEEFRRTWYERIPMGRMGEPEELTGVMVMLCSRAGRYITGSDIGVDGGITVF